MINLLVITRGVFGGADEMATRIGVTNRFRLGRLLRREGLPPFGELADWTCLLQLLSEAEVKRAPLLRLARLAGLEPATCYRRCKRLLGVPARWIDRVISRLFPLQTGAGISDAGPPRPLIEPRQHDEFCSLARSAS